MLTFLLRWGKRNQQSFEAQMNSFFLLFNRYLLEKAKGEKLLVPSHLLSLTLASSSSSPSRVADILARFRCVGSVWDKINPPAAEQVVPYADLPESTDGSILRKLAVLKLNGGLGESKLSNFQRGDGEGASSRRERREEGWMEGERAEEAQKRGENELELTSCWLDE